MTNVSDYRLGETKMIHRTQEGWIVNTKTVWNALDSIVHELNKTGSFHYTEIATILEQAGCNVIKTNNSDTDLSQYGLRARVTIGENQIRSILNAVAREGNPEISRDGGGWYVIN